VQEEATVANFRKIDDYDKTGYDEGRAWQVLPASQRTNFYLVAGTDLDVSVDDANLVTVSAGAADDRHSHRTRQLSAWENEQVIRKVSLVAGRDAGETTLHAKLNGADFVQPITVQVVADQDWRRVGKAAGQCDKDLRAEIQSLSLRDAVMRVAEDQMHSGICSRSNGFGVYDIDEQYNWCGAFAYWCWKQAAFIKQVDNPFGSDSRVLWSPQRAISWAMIPASPAEVLRFQGSDPMLGKATQKYREIGYNGYALERADIVLVRKDTAGGWHHVCMVDTVSGNVLNTMEGNQGRGQSIKKRTRSLRDKTPDGVYCLAFLHVFV
jgi:hypothetical protein